MKRNHVVGSITFFLLLFILFQFVFINSIYAKDREILYISKNNKKLQEIVAFIQTPVNKQKCSLMTQQRNYFVRIAPTEYTLSENKSIKDNAILGTKPYVFLTTPEEICGKSLLDIYLNIGYEAEDIIKWQKDVDMVAIVFCYPQEILYSKVTDGLLPASWNNYIYSPTWDNIFSIFSKLALKATIEPDKKGEFSPERMFFRSKDEQNFVLNFSKEAKQTIKQSSYISLEANGGINWNYRKLLENKLSIFEHFRGNGRTINEIVDPDGNVTDSGILEFVGPNRRIKELPEVAVIHLGSLQIYDRYSVK